MFSEFSLTNAGKVHHGLIEWINDNKEEIMENLKIALRHRNTSFKDWLKRTSEYKTPADELAIYCLARMYQ